MRRVSLPPGLYEFKAVVYDATTKAARWELTPNRTIQVRSRHSAMLN